MKDSTEREIRISMVRMQRTVWKMGFEASERNVPYRAVPFPIGADARRWWQQGWKEHDSTRERPDENARP